MTELAMAGDAFSFKLDSGYKGFDTPATYAKFNRAFKARIDVYLEQYDAAMSRISGSRSSSMIRATLNFNAGVFHVYSTAAGDPAQWPDQRRDLRPSGLQTDAQKQAGGVSSDARYTPRWARPRRRAAPAPIRD